MRQMLLLGRKVLALPAIGLTTILLVQTALRPPASYAQTIGSKSFTENVILGEIAVQLTDADAHRKELGGTAILWNALLAGDIDIYPEYTGTLLQEIFSGHLGSSPRLSELRDSLEQLGVGMTEPLGFNDTYVLGMREETADRLGITRISDLPAHPKLRYGFSNEFMDRDDGWPSLRVAYNLPSDYVRGIDHDLGYRAMESGSIDVKDLYSTDAEIAYYHLATLEDDRHHFPEYRAIYLYRLDLDSTKLDALQRITGQIDERQMIAMNGQAKLDGVAESTVAREFVRSLGLATRGLDRAETWLDRLAGNTKDHLFLVIVSLLAAIALAIPLGILASRNATTGRIILGVVGAVYTIPSLALLVFMIPLLGIGGPPALVALFLYSLLPIVRNTHEGLTGIPRSLTESAEVLGLPERTILLKIKLPLSSGAILAGIKTSAVINIGTATLGALIGAGGYGQPILTGIRLDDTSLILEGAVPAAVLALLAQALFDLSERWFVPRGLRLSREQTTE